MKKNFSFQSGLKARCSTSSLRRWGADIIRHKRTINVTRWNTQWAVKWKCASLIAQVSKLQKKVDLFTEVNIASVRWLTIFRHDEWRLFFQETVFVDSWSWPNGTNYVVLQKVDFRRTISGFLFFAPRQYFSCSTYWKFCRQQQIWVGQFPPIKRAWFRAAVPAGNSSLVNRVF